MGQVERADERVVLKSGEFFCFFKLRERGESEKEAEPFLARGQVGGDEPASGQSADRQARGVGKLFPDGKIDGDCGLVEKVSDAIDAAGDVFGPKGNGLRGWKVVFMAGKGH